MDPVPAFEVTPYRLDGLIELVAQGSYRKSPEDIRGKRHFQYLEGYLESLGARTVVTEYGYIDRDFLEDYAAYYVRCFPPYQKECTRLHFFSESFTREAFESCLSGEERPLSAAQLRHAYLGFMVVKNLPQTMIGRTCLATYPETAERSFPVARAFEAHLFGIQLVIEKTLPFQEQDNVVAACATSALWTVFQATARHFQHQLLSPIEITRAATHLLPAETRIIPNRGLSTHMMAHAIRSVNLEPLLIRVTERYLLQAAIYGYVHAGIPLILGVDLIDALGGDRYAPQGKHALAVMGYGLGGALQPIGPSGLLLRASRLNKIYVHDDQIGPFARMELNGVEVEISSPGAGMRKAESLSTFWPSENPPDGAVRAVPDMLLVPLYHKIRISWEWVLKTITQLDEFFTQSTRAMDVLKLDALEWDVYLSTLHEVKHELHGHASLTPERKFRVVTRRMPRFIWRATARRNHEAIVDVLFDATDIDTGDALVEALIYDDFTREFVKELAPDLATLPIAKNVRTFLHRVLDNP